MLQIIRAGSNKVPVLLLAAWLPEHEQPVKHYVPVQALLWY